MTDSAATPKSPKLTSKQEQFCREYVIDSNGRQAAIRAGYSPKTATEISSEYLMKPHVQARVAELQAERQKRTDRSADEVLKKIWELAEFQLEDVCSFDGEEVTFKPSSEWSQRARTTVRNIKQTSTTTYDRQGNPCTKNVVEIKAESLTSALDMLLKNYGMTSDFNTAIATLRRYGLFVKCKDGKYYLSDATDTTTDDD